MTKVIQIEDDSQDTYLIPVDKIAFVKKYNQFQQYSSHHYDYKIHISVIDHDRLIVKSFDNLELFNTYFDEISKVLTSDK